MSDSLSNLLACLDLRPLPAEGGEADGRLSFEGDNLPLEYHRLFGGQILAQFVRAAALACPQKTVKSVHTLFPREGRSGEPVRYDVTRHHEGGTFATLSLVASQPARGVIATAAVSLHITEDGPAYQTPVEVPPVPGPEHRLDIGMLVGEPRAVADLNAREAAEPEYDLWLRTPEVDPALAQAIALYNTDLTLIGTALRPVDGISQQDAQQAFASGVTSHTIWFHRPFRTDAWLLLHQHSPILAQGRCFGRGDILTEDGTLVASFAQEAMLRFKQ